VTGDLEITSSLTDALPILDVGDTANPERVEGRLSLIATDGAGTEIRIEGGTFDLTVIASRVKLSLS
jgi:hypothetical protein